MAEHNSHSRNPYDDEEDVIEANKEVDEFYNLTPEERQNLLSFQDYLKMNAMTFDEVKEALKNRQNEYFYLLGVENTSIVTEIRKNLRHEIITWENGRMDMFHDSTFNDVWKKKNQERIANGEEPLSVHEMYTEFILNEPNSRLIMVIPKNFFNFVSDSRQGIATTEPTSTSAGSDQTDDDYFNQYSDKPQVLATIREFNYIAQHIAEYDPEKFLFVVE